MDTPQSWLIRPKEALYDLDNIQLSKLSAKDRVSGLKAVFDLDYSSSRVTLARARPAVRRAVCRCSSSLVIQRL